MQKIITCLALLFSFGINAQKSTLSGSVKDNITGAPVIGAKVELRPAESVFRTKTNQDGGFTIQNIPYGNYTVVVSMLGMDSLFETIELAKPLETIELGFGKTIEQEEVRVVSSLVIDRKTPVAVSTIGTKEISEELGSQDLPMILNSKPGVHATQQGGGDGDARITIRGFDQRNVGVMIDGVPVNDMENGAVYWSNWFGLDAITGQIQIQRGLGATKLAMPSVGGTMNIITQSTGGKREINALQEYGSGNFLRTSLSYKSGNLKNGWGILFSGSYKQGQGWVDGLNTQGGFYYLKVQKKIKNHVVSLSGFGAPQQHGQRSFSQPIAFWDAKYARSLFTGSDDLYNVIDRFNATKDSSAYMTELSALGLDTGSVKPYYVSYADTNNAADRGIRYNPHWGYRTVDGKQTVYNERRNFYHKPQITLKDFWKINEKLSISNLAYVSIGRGGGQRYFNSSSTILYDENGQIDWDTIIYSNQYKTLFGQTYTTADALYDPVKLKSSQIISASMNNHFWLGGLSQFDYKANNVWSFAGGLDYRYYKGTHFNEILDLLGGEYYVNKSDQNASTPMKVVGDKIADPAKPYQNYRDGLVQWAGGFIQTEYSKGQWNAFVNASMVGNFYKGIDYFRPRQLQVGDTTLEIGYADTVTYNGQTYDRNSEGLQYNQTDWVSKVGFTFKTGANYNVTERSNIFLNVGYLSRTPQFSNVIDNTRNRVFDELLNEKIIAFEAGYGFRSKKVSVNTNAYYTRWENRPLPFGLSIPDPNDPTERIAVNVPGMDALHMGIEVDAVYQLNKKISIEAMASLGDWTWQSAETITFLTDTITFDATGVKVGNSAQSTYAASIRYAFVKNGYIKIKYTFFDRYYSDFNPNDLTPESGTAGRQPWRIPSYGLMSVHAGYRVKFENSSLNFRANVFNALNTLYISDATNNNNFVNSAKDFNANSASVFVGQGLQFNVGVGFEF